MSASNPMSYSADRYSPAGFDADYPVELIVQRVRLTAHRRYLWLQHTLCDDSQLDDNRGDEFAWYRCNGDLQVLNASIGEVDALLAGKAGAQLRHLADLFALSSAELDVLQTCFACAIEPALAPVFALLHKNPAQGYVSEALCARLFGHGRQPAWVPGKGLALWRLVVPSSVGPGEPTPLAIDPVLASWLCGQIHEDEHLVGSVRMIEASPPLPGWPVEDIVNEIRSAQDRQVALRIAVAGPEGSGRRQFAAAVVARLEGQLLAADTAGVTDSEWLDAFVRIQRLAMLCNAAVLWHGTQLTRAWPQHLVPANLQFFACDSIGESIPAGDGVTVRIELPALTVDQRQALWHKAVPWSASWCANDMRRLAARHSLTQTEIDSVGDRNPQNASQAARYARELTRGRMGELGQMLDCPFTFDDLVVPARLRDALQDFVFEATERNVFWENPRSRRLFPRGRGLVALFNGPPGTGKTMAAQIVSAKLELDLFRIDLATVVSKYIGETAKNIRRIFERAQRLNAVLLFDEADALFSRRTEVKDAHDRHANADTSYLLQQLEDYNGIAILASNKKQNIDPAFVRRLRYVFEFPRPSAAERRQIWTQVIAQLFDAQTAADLDNTIAALATCVNLNGAQIKNAVLASSFIAKRQSSQLAPVHITKGVERELNKDGRSLTADELERLINA